MPVRRTLLLDSEALSRLEEFQELTGMTTNDAANFLLKIAASIRSDGKKGGARKTKRGKKGKRTKISVRLEDELAEIKSPSATLAAALLAVDPLVKAILPKRGVEEGGLPSDLLGMLEKEAEALISNLTVFKALISEKREGGVAGPEEEAVLIRELLYLLAEELDKIRERPEYIKAYRRVVPPEDVGYVTTLMSALYSDDRLRRWVLTTDYRRRGDGR